MKLDKRLQRHWYGEPGWLLLLLPAEWLFRAVTGLRRWLFRRGWRQSYRAPVPVVVVGNIAVGGTGKTPVTIALCEALRDAGLRPGIVSRGYGARPPAFPHLVDINDSAERAGDEPLLLARRTGRPVVIAPRRAEAVRLLLQTGPCDVVLCDDGLQHYALARDVELAVIDGTRGLGNGHCLPVGPLREPPSRLDGVDAVLINTTVSATDNGGPHAGFYLQPTALVRLADGRRVDVEQWRAEHRHVHAVAGIGNPWRFFASLRELGFEVIEHPFPDHHRFIPADFTFGDGLPVVMTEKDAVKCDGFGLPDLWYLTVDAVLPGSLLTAIVGKIAGLHRRG
jgi:tetraacyldisaccharide 4'-kinase